MKQDELRSALVFFLLLVFSVSTPTTWASAPRPNVVVILSDDQGWGDFSLHGNRNLRTPVIDGLARAGARFDRFFVCPVCSPTRAEFLTGRYHPRSGVYSTSAGGERMDLEEQTIAEVFRSAGYATAAFGKWHNGMQYPYHPNGRGFQEFYGFCSGHWGNYFSPPLEHNGRLVRGKGFLIDDLTNHCMQFIEQNRDRPFFAYLPFNTPHSPMQVPDRWWDRFKNKELAMHNRDPRRENLQHIRAAMAMCENIDWNVGRLLKKLDELQIAKRTIVVYFNDNGPNGVRWNGGMKGRKGSTDEGGVRSPLFVRWPGTIPAGRTIRPLGAAIDLLPTLADLAGISFTSAQPLDGVSLKRLLVGATDTAEDRLIFSHWRGRVSVRNQRFRLDHRGKLFDMQRDPGQRRDVALKHPRELKRLQAAVEHWKRDVLGNQPRKLRPFLVGDPQFRYTQLPARDARPMGGIQRSNRFPNCSYFLNWTQTSDKLVWPVEVRAAGQYEVEVHYAVAEKNVGATLELRLGDQFVRGKIERAHDPPVRGAEHDRVKRQESYVKDFRPLNLGIIRLKKGRGNLTLQALRIPGEEALEFRLLMLKKMP